MSPAPVEPSPSARRVLASHATLAFCLGAAGLPLRLLVPLVWLERTDLPVTTVAASLLLLLVLDACQQPFLARLARASRRHSRASAWAAGLLLAASSGALLVPPSGAPVAAFATPMAMLAAARGFLSIRLRASGVARADRIAGGHLRLVAWRETGALVGAAFGLVLPTGLVVLQLPVDPFAGLAVVLSVASLAAIAAMPGNRDPERPTDGGAGAFPADPDLRRLLAIGLAVASPIGAAPALLLACVSVRLLAPGAAGTLLVASIVAAAASVPLWRRFAARWGARRGLFGGLVASLVCCVWAAAIGPDDIAPVAALCVGIGIAGGAERVFAQTLLARRIDALAASGCGPNPLDVYALQAALDRLVASFVAVIALAGIGAAGLAIGHPDDAPPVWIAVLLFFALPAGAKVAALFLLVRSWTALR